jgi:hypothetical protein
MRGSIDWPGIRGKRESGDFRTSFARAMDSDDSVASRARESGGERAAHQTLREVWGPGANVPVYGRR